VARPAAGGDSEQDYRLAAVEGALAALELDVPAPVLVLLEVEPVPVLVPVPLVEPGVVDELVPGVVVVVDGLPVPLVEVLLLVLPPGVVLLLVPPLGVVVAEVLLESRVVVVTSSRFVQAVRDASAIRVMAPACAIFKAVMADPFGKVAKRLMWFTDVPVLLARARVP